MLYQFSHTDSDLKEWLLQHIKTVQGHSSETDKHSSLSRNIHDADIKSCAMLVQYLCTKHGELIPDCVKEHVVEVILAKDDGKGVDADSSRVCVIGLSLFP